MAERSGAAQQPPPPFRETRLDPENTVTTDGSVGTTAHSQICFRNVTPTSQTMTGKGQAECRETRQTAVLRVQTRERAVVVGDSKGDMSKRS